LSSSRPMGRFTAPFALPALLSFFMMLLASCGRAPEDGSPSKGAAENASNKPEQAPGSETAQGPAKKTQGPRRVHVHELAPRRVEERVPTVSHIEAWRQVDIVSRVQAQIVEVRAIEGQTVSEGELLVQLDDRQPKLEVESAKAREAEILDLEREAEVALAEAKKRLELAEKDMAKAKNDLERSRASAKEELVSPAQLESDELDFERAVNQVELQQISVRKAQLGLDKLATDKRTAEIQRKIAERILDDYSIEAPFNGIVSSTIVKGGEWISPQGQLLQITDKERLVVYFSRPQQEFGHIRVGQSVRLRVDAFPGETFEGRLAFVAPLVDRQTGTFRTRAEIDDPDNRLRAGMYTRAEIVTAVSDQALMIPRTAIFYEAEEPFAFVVRGGKAQRMTIRPGIATKSAIEAANSSLTEDPPGQTRELFRPGDQVVVVGAEDLETGRAVEVTGRRDLAGQLIVTQAANASAKQDG
jgi:RND family efflux transporter MFP subunit